jgi:hypothetical protein
MKYVLSVLGAIALTGCMSNPPIDDLSPQQRAQLSSIVVFNDTPERGFDVLGTVTGLSCNRNAHQAQDVSDREALEGIKVKAAKMGCGRDH